MKKSTRFLMTAGMAAMIAAPASADVQWNLWRDNGFIGNEAAAAFMMDLNNNGRLDLLTTGTSWVAEWEGKPGVFSWQSRTSIYYNEGATWKSNVLTVVPDGTDEEVVKDEEGNPVMGEDGKPVTVTKQRYKLENPHGIMAMEQSRITGIDYNNDGLLDLFCVGTVGGNDQFHEWEKVNNYQIPGDGNRHGFVVLYKNNGDGTFSLVEEAQFPAIYMQDDEDKGDAMFHKTVAVADYDHDGYTDILICGKHLAEQEDGYPKQFTGLFHNDGGTGKFTQMNIAKVQGGVWTKEISVDDGEGNSTVVVEKKELPGWFLPTEHNCHFVDLNNDGWVDIVTDGYVPVVADGTNESGTLARIYLNRDGKEFEDVTPLIPTLDKNNVPRSACSAFADFDKDGYMDFFTSGWTDAQGAQVRLYSNQSSFSDNIFEDFSDQSIIQNEGGQETEWLERTATQIRDFDGDGILDICFEGKGDYYFYYGQADDTFMRGSIFASRGFGAKSAHGAFGDVTANGLADYYQVGYVWRIEEIREPESGDWAWGHYMYKNETDVAVEAPEVPVNVVATMKDGQLTVTWNDVEEEGECTSAYNISVKYPSGKIFAIIPADMETGFVRNSEGKWALVRPLVESYTMSVDEEGEYTVGVQAVSTYNETYSKFNTVKVKNDNAGVENVAKAGFNVEVAGDNIIVTGTDEAVAIFDIAGRKVAAGVAGEAISVPARGVFMVSAGDNTKKIVK